MVYIEAWTLKYADCIYSIIHKFWTIEKCMKVDSLLQLHVVGVEGYTQSLLQQKLPLQALQSVGKYLEWYFSE